MYIITTCLLLYNKVAKLLLPLSGIEDPSQKGEKHLPGITLHLVLTMGFKTETIT